MFLGLLLSRKSVVYLFSIWYKAPALRKLGANTRYCYPFDDSKWQLSKACLLGWSNPFGNWTMGL